MRYVYKDLFEVCPSSCLLSSLRCMCVRKTDSKWLPIIQLETGFCRRRKSSLINPEAIENESSLDGEWKIIISKLLNYKISPKKNTQQALRSEKTFCLITPNKKFRNGERILTATAEAAGYSTNYPGLPRKAFHQTTLVYEKMRSLSVQNTTC